MRTPERRVRHIAPSLHPREQLESPGGRRLEQVPAAVGAARKSPPAPASLYAAPGGRDGSTVTPFRRCPRGPAHRRAGLSGRPPYSIGTPAASLGAGRRI